MFAYNLILSLYKHLRARTNFLEMYNKWACIHDYIITRQMFQLSLILRLCKIVHVLGIGTTCINWDNLCATNGNLFISTHRFLGLRASPNLLLPHPSPLFSPSRTLFKEINMLSQWKLSLLTIGFVSLDGIEIYKDKLDPSVVVDCQNHLALRNYNFCSVSLS